MQDFWVFGNKDAGGKHEIKLKVNVPRKQTTIVLLKEKIKRLVSFLDLKVPKISFKTGHYGKIPHFGVVRLEMSQACFCCLIRQF